MLQQTLHLSLLCNFSLPVELRFKIIDYFVVAITDDTFEDAVNEYYYAHKSKRKSTRYARRRNHRLWYGPIACWDTSRVTSIAFIFCDKHYIYPEFRFWNLSNVVYYCDCCAILKA